MSTRGSEYGNSGNETNRSEGKWKLLKDKHQAIQNRDINYKILHTIRC